MREDWLVRIRRTWAAWDALTRAGALLTALGVVTFSVVLPLTLIGKPDAVVSRRGNFAQILSLTPVLLGVALWLFRRSIRRLTITAEALDEAAEKLADAVAAKETRQRARLIGLAWIDMLDTHPADITFEKDLIHYRDVGGGYEDTLGGVLAYYKSLVPGRLVIIGKAGSGKTVLALELMIALLSNRDTGGRGDDRAQRPWRVPVRLSAATWDTDESFEQWLCQQLVDGYDVGSAVARQLVGQRRILPILDGLDEMDRDDRPPTRAEAAIGQLDAYLDVRGGRLAPLILTCREQRYEQLTKLHATCVTIQPLSSRQIDEYIRRHLTGLDEEWRWRPLLERVSDPNDGFAEAMSTPWMLTLLLTATRDPVSALQPSELARLDPADVREALLERFVPAAARRYPPRRGKARQPEEAVRRLRLIADHLAWQKNRHNMSPTDILLHRWWPIAGPEGPRYCHALVAFATSIIAALLVAWVVIGSPTVWVAAVQSSLTSDWTISTVAAWVLAALALLVVPGLAARSAARYWPEPRRLYLRGIGSRRQLFLVAAIGIVGYLLGSAAGLTAGHGLGVSIGVPVALAVAVVASLRLEGPISTALGPRRILRDDLLGGFFGVLVLGVASAVAGLRAFGRPEYGATGLLIGILVALLYWPAFGSVAAVRYGIAVVFLTATGKIPLGFASFLDWACDAGLMRLSGVAYQFRHKELQDWLSAPLAAPDDDGHRDSLTERGR
jgi:hypothetical protein